MNRHEKQIAALEAMRQRLLDNITWLSFAISGGISENDFSFFCPPLTKEQYQALWEFGEDALDLSLGYEHLSLSELSILLDSKGAFDATHINSLNLKITDPLVIATHSRFMRIARRTQ